MKRVTCRPALLIAMIVFMGAMPARLLSQPFTFIVHTDPLISWMGSNESEYTSMGARPGFDIGLNVLHYFAENYAISSGISFFSAGGRQSLNTPHTMVFTNMSRTIAAGDEIKYNLKYMNLPAGLRLQTNPIGYLTYFTDLGFDLRLLLKSTIDLPSVQIFDENAGKEVYGMNAGWHIGAGIEYELPFDASLIAGISYAQDFFDVTKDLKDVNQPSDRSTLRMFRIRFGFKF